MPASLPPFCSFTRSSHDDLSFCDYCGLAESYRPSRPLYTPSVSSTAERSNSIAPIEVPDSPTTVPIRMNPVSSSFRVAEGSKDLTNKRISSRESLKAGFHAGSSAVSHRGGLRPGQVLQAFKFLVAIIFQDWTFESARDEARGIRSIVTREKPCKL
jgi:hypothetical protein